MKPEHDARARDKILFFLKTKGPQTAATLGRRLGVTPMAVRQHLYQLEVEKFVDHYDERRKVGRPARYWRLTNQATTKFPDNHGELAVGIIEAARAAFGNRGIEKLIAERKRQQLISYADRIKADAPLEKKIAALAQIRNDEGYMAEWSREPDGTLVLIENHCPICAAAQTCQDLCTGEMDLFRSVLGDDVAVERTEHIMAGARRCTYRVRPAVTA
ncbi:MAG: transcriptional regulator [Planctomycetes bacterium]|nr:transcriptional regulator [Planctomycetota bacterium]